MTTQEARDIFTKAAQAAADRGDKDAAARAELAREYFTNPEFRAALADHLWNAGR